VERKRKSKREERREAIRMEKKNNEILINE